MISIAAAQSTTAWTPDDIFASCYQETIEYFKEDNQVERKCAQVSQKDFADYLSMWANTQPHGGIVFIGVEKDGTITGCAGTETKHLNELETIQRFCSDARHEFKKVPLKNPKGQDDYVLFLRVYYRQEKLVEMADGNAYAREGEEKRRQSETEKREIRLNKGELDVESEPTSPRFPDDFDIRMLNEYRNQYLAKCQLGRAIPSRAF